MCRGEDLKIYCQFWSGQAQPQWKSDAVKWWGASESEWNLASSSTEVVVEALGNKSAGTEEVIVLEEDGL